MTKDTLSQAKEYLAQVLPWPAEDEPGYIDIHWTVKRPDRDRAFWDGRAVRSVAEAARTIEWAKSLPDTRDIYACQSRQAMADERTSQKGNKYLKAIRSQENAVAMKSFYLDIDAKGEAAGGYDTLKDAAAALGSFIKNSGMPSPSAIVKSGGGLHVYWALAIPITPTEWLPLAYALVEATKKFGLKCDTACSIDSARVLRIPDTSNHKTTPPHPVQLARTGHLYSLDALTKVLDKYKGTAPVRVTLFEDGTVAPTQPVGAKLGGESDLAAGIDTHKFDPIDIRKVAPNCGFIKDAVTTGGKNYTNPLWNLTTLIATFLDDGWKMAQVMAKGHPGYTRESTSELYERKVKERETKNIGWPSCATIAASGATQCATCPFFKEGKSPLNLAHQNTGAMAEIAKVATAIVTDDVPEGYKRRSDGIITKTVTLEDGNEVGVPICKKAMTMPWLYDNPLTLNYMTMTHKPTQVSVEAEVLGTQEFRRTMQRQGVVLPDKDLKLVGEFFVSWISKLQASKGAVVSVQPFGWFDNDRSKLEGFSFGGRLYTPDGVKPAPNPDPVTAKQYEPCGDIDVWKRGSKLITDQERPDLNAALASAFAAPLVRFTNHVGMVMSMYSTESGYGKTTALKVAQAVWGDPIKALQGLSDTHKSVMNLTGELKSLPMYWDELKTEEQTKKFVSMIFEITSGREARRLTREVKQRATGSWQTLLISASNESLVDVVAHKTKTTTAGLVRMFEFEVTAGSKGRISGVDADKIVAALNVNFGTAGLEYAKFLGANHEQIALEVYNTSKALEIECKPTQEERYWMATICALIMGARYANQLGLTDINEDELKKFLVTELDKMRISRNEQPVDMKNVDNLSNLMAQFLSDMSGKNTLWTDYMHINAGPPPIGYVTSVRDTTRLDAVNVHIALDSKRMRISKPAFDLWLMRRGYTPTLISNVLKDEMGATVKMAKLGVGTNRCTAQQQVIDIDLRDPRCVGLVEE